MRTKISYDPMVERMNCALRLAARHAGDDLCDKRLYIRRLDFDVRFGRAANCAQRLIECWYDNSRSKLDRLEVRCGKCGQRATSKFRLAGSRYVEVMMDDDDTIGSCMDIELDRIGAQVEGRPKRRNRVFGVSVANSPVSNCFDYPSLQLPAL